MTARRLLMALLLAVIPATFSACNPVPYAATPGTM